MVEQALLKDTLQKINASLNKRFERDDNLYISKQDEYELKKHICNHAYGAVMDMMKGKNISPEIVMKILVRNAGIITIDNISSFEKKVKPIFESVQYKTITYMMEDVLNNTVYMQKDLKHLLFKYYVDGITAKARLEYWKYGDYDFDAAERKILFYAILEKTKHSDENKILQFKMDFIKDAFTRFPILLQDRDVFLLLKEASTASDKQKLFKQLCSEMEKPSIKDELYNHIVLDAYVSYGSKAFDDAVSKIKGNSPENYKQYIKAIAKMFGKEKDGKTAIKMFDTMVKVFESPHLKQHVKSRINNKVWKVTKRNADLYKARKVKINQLLANTEPIVNKKYTTFKDVMKDIQEGEDERTVAFFWINMKRDAFKQSLIKSFSQTPGEYQNSMREIYDWLFFHSQKKGGGETLAQTCDTMASAILTNGDISGMAKSADKFLLDNILKYGLKGNNIKSYLSTYHFEEYKKKYVD